MISLKNQWRQGPIQSIPLMPQHGRPIFCMSVEDNNVVTGSADHGLREYNMETCKYIRQLFGKKYGHKQWVSTCAYSNRKVLSGGMDSVVCLWEQKGVKCDHFTGHHGSISKVMACDDIGISASYDATMILWDLKRKKEATKLIGPHKEAIMEFAWNNSLLVSGDKAGILAIWDLNQQKAIKAIKTHKGAVSNVQFYSNKDDNIIVTTGLNDGTLIIQDMRTHNTIYQEMIHKGSVNALKIYDGKIFTASADHFFRIFSYPGMKPIHKIDTKDMIFAIQNIHDMSVVGSGNGNVLAYDNNTGECLYGYGAIKKGACRLLGINKNKNRLVCAGQDDNAIVLKYS